MMLMMGIWRQQRVPTVQQGSRMHPLPTVLHHHPYMHPLDEHVARRPTVDPCSLLGPMHLALHVALHLALHLALPLALHPTCLRMEEREGVRVHPSPTKRGMPCVLATISSIILGTWLHRVWVRSPWLWDQWQDFRECLLRMQRDLLDCLEVHS